eukprot:gnl/Trimastix_PCT/2351.p1 GENE.gnl/Trimastix_PCT/2351~~gnl/Trimastix_PCT/2351.p1  ORF type:complete len:297 (+),score=68.57 gnl/Trimastix_PCT/2351:48-938(+)
MNPELALVRKKEEWIRTFDQSVESDLWGQPLEAIDGYERLANLIRRTIDQNTDIPTQDLNTLRKVKVCLTLRLRVIQQTGRGTTLDEMQRLKPVLRNLFATQSLDFPVDLRMYEDELSATDAMSTTGERSEVRSRRRETAAQQSGSLLPPPSLVSGINLNITVSQIDYPNAPQFVDPRIRVTVAERNGNHIEPQQCTPVSADKQASHVVWNSTVHIQTPLEQLNSDVAMFFEFLHFKPRGSYNSTRCWAMLEMDEIKPGPCVLELYKKPCDWRRKRVRLLTRKPQYLHLVLSLIIP